MISEPLVLGLDLATAHARVLALGLDTGATHAQAGLALPAPVAPQPGHSEQEAGYARVARALISGLTAELGPAAENIRALSVTGTSGTVVPCDDAGVPTGAALMYNDQRATEETAVITRHGSIGPAAALARIGWLEHHAPAARYLSTPDTVHADLAGGPLDSDTSHWLKAGIAVDSGNWDEALLQELRIPRGKLPELLQPGTVLGEVASGIARELGLPEGVLIIAGMTDGCTAQIGAGAVREGDVVGVLGTTLVLKSVAARNVGTDDFVIYSHRSPDGHYWPGGASNVGAGILGSRYGSSAQELTAGNALALAHGVAQGICYPLAGTGERFPFAAPDAAFFSVGGDGSRADDYRSIMEGVAFTERLGIERLSALGVAPRRFLATGGGSSSELWNTIRATVLGKEVLRPESHNSAFGAALIAAGALSGETLAQLAGRMVRIGDSFEPDPEQGPALEENYQRFITELTRRGYVPG